jgi:hypothetical protein
MAESTTSVTDVDPQEFLTTLTNERQRTESIELLELMAEVSGEPPRMWGPTMIGFGQVHYRYDSGREGDMFTVGFAPRRGKFALYGFLDWPGSDAILERLGPHQRAVACLYVTRLSVIDRDVLRELVEQGWAANGGWDGVAPSSR